MISALASKLSALPAPDGFPRLVVGATVALVLAAVIMLLRAEGQGEVLVVLAGLVGFVVALEKTQTGVAVVGALSRHTTMSTGMALAAAFVLLGVFHEDHYVLLMIATVAFFTTACAGLTIQMGFAGVPNFAGAAFFSIGAYTAAVLVPNTAVPHVLVLVAGGLMAGLIGVVLLLPVLRTSGHYAALVTIAFGLLLRSFLDVNDALGGPQGLKIPGLTLFGANLNELREIGSVEISFYLPYAAIAVLMLAATMWLVRLVEHSWVGVSLDTTRADEIAASNFGLSIAWWKASAFLFGNILIGVAGAAYGMMNGFANPHGTGFGESLLMLSIVVLGGLGNMWGALAAAVVILVIPEKLQAIQEYRLLIFSVLVILILRFRAKGLLPRPMRDLSGAGKGASKGGDHG